MASDAEILNQCSDWVGRGRDADVDSYFFERNNISFEDCQQFVQDARAGGASTGAGGPRFFTWGTLTTLVLALLVPFAVVAFYTGFTFKWKAQRAASGGDEKK